MVVQREAEVWVNLGVAIIGKIKSIDEDGWVILETFRGETIKCQQKELRDIRELYHI